MGQGPSYSPSLTASMAAKSFAMVPAGNTKGHIMHLSILCTNHTAVSRRQAPKLTGRQGEHNEENRGAHGCQSLCFSCNCTLLLLCK